MRVPFRAVQTVVDPSGDYWGLYVTRTVPERRGPGAPALFDDSMIGFPFGDSITMLALPVAVVDFAWSCLLVPLGRAVVRTPGAFVRGRRSNVAWIQAVRLYGAPRRTRTWTTTINDAPGAVDAIAAGLQRGRVVQPRGAVYAGEVDD